MSRSQDDWVMLSPRPNHNITPHNTHQERPNTTQLHRGSSRSSSGSSDGFIDAAAELSPRSYMPLDRQSEIDNQKRRPPLLGIKEGSQESVVKPEEVLAPRSTTQPPLRDTVSVTQNSSTPPACITPTTATASVLPIRSPATAVASPRRMPRRGFSALESFLGSGSELDLTGLGALHCVSSRSSVDLTSVVPSPAKPAFPPSPLPPAHQGAEASPLGEEKPHFNETFFFADSHSHEAFKEAQEIAGVRNGKDEPTLNITAENRLPVEISAQEEDHLDEESPCSTLLPSVSPGWAVTSAALFFLTDSRSTVFSAAMAGLIAATVVNCVCINLLSTSLVTVRNNQPPAGADSDADGDGTTAALKQWAARAFATTAYSMQRWVRGDAQDTAATTGTLSGKARQQQQGLFPAEVATELWKFNPIARVLIFIALLEAFGEFAQVRLGGGEGGSVDTAATSATPLVNVVSVIRYSSLLVSFSGAFSAWSKAEARKNQK